MVNFEVKFKMLIFMITELINLISGTFFEKGNNLNLYINKESVILSNLGNFENMEWVEKKITRVFLLKISEK